MIKKSGRKGHFARFRVQILEHPGGGYSPAVGVTLDAGIGVNTGHGDIFYGLVHAEAISSANLQVLDELDAQTEVPSNIAFLSLEVVHDFFADAEREVRTGQDVRTNAQRLLYLVYP